MAYSYYGDKLSNNIVLTDEGYLICLNVPIGRVGYMEYLGQELPPVYKLPANKVFKVKRSAEELFSPETIASFEGKPVTNMHPNNNLDVTTANMAKRGHVQNVRKEGDFLVADLFVDDPLLIQEIQSGNKRNVSGGYDCSWHDLGNGEFEQRNILGNHVAVVKEGRAGPRVTIRDQKPEKIGGNKLMNKPITQKFLAAIGLKHFAQDAEPEQIEEALEAMKEPAPEVKKPAPVADAPVAPAPVAPAAPAAPAPEPAAPAKDDDTLLQILEILGKVVDRIEKIEQMEKSEPQHAEESEKVLDAAEVDFSKDLPDEEGSESEVGNEEEPAVDEEPAAVVEKKAVVTSTTGEEPEKQDEKFKKFVADMRPIIMAIPDEKLRLAGAQTIVKFAKDARNASAVNGYANILATVNENKKAAADKAREQASVNDAAAAACKKWKEQGEQMKGGR